MRKIAAIFTGVLLVVSNYSFAPGADWKGTADKLVSEFSSCSGAECKSYVAKALKAIYGISDFDAANKPGGMLDVNSVANYIKKSSNWKLLGDASSQDILKQAQDAANNNKAVVAMMVSDNGADHIAIIAPGSLTACGGMKYPNSISFFINSPSKSYSGKPLAYSFRSMDGIKVYVRS